MTVKTTFGTYDDCWLEISHYICDDSLAIRISNAECGPVATITTCIDGFMLQKNEAYIDTNNCPWAEDFIKGYQLGKPTGRKVRSGFCEYPVYRFNMGTLRSYM